MTNLSSTHNIVVNSLKHRLDVNYYFSTTDSLMTQPVPRNISIIKLDAYGSVTSSNGVYDVWLTLRTDLSNFTPTYLPIDFYQACLLWLKSDGFAGLNLVEYLQGLGFEIE